MQRVINFSGGKTSAFMTIKYYQIGDIVLFCDTGREHNKTYKFINDFEAFEGIPVVRLKYGGENIIRQIKNAEWWLEKFSSKEVIPEGNDIEEMNKRIKNLTEEFDKLNPFDKFLEAKEYKRVPNRMQRFCTEELKVNTAKRYLRSIGVTKYENLIGFRSDEPRRVLTHKEKFVKVKTKFPLYEDKIDKQMINEYWKHKHYTLEIPSILGNCTLCFMKGKNSIISIMSLYPELAEVWINDEKESKKKFGHKYFPDTTYEQLLSIAQNNLFKDYDLNEIKPAFDCACTA